MRDFEVVCDHTNNTQEDIDQGRLNVSFSVPMWMLPPSFERRLAEDGKRLVQVSPGVWEVQDLPSFACDPCLGMGWIQDDGSDSQLYTIGDNVHVTYDVFVVRYKQCARCSGTGLYVSRQRGGLT